MFFTYFQNNSGGKFLLDKEKGITFITIISAKNEEEANKKAEEIGIYFDGCIDNLDCPCCGDRWSRLWNEKGHRTPKIYLETLKKYIKDLRNRWVEKGFTVCIHYANGKKVWY